MSKQWGHGFHKGEETGLKIGEQFGEAKTQADLGMKALCLATAIRKAQKADNVSQYVLMEVLIDLLAAECGGRIDENESPNVEVQGLDASAACRPSPGTKCWG